MIFGLSLMSADGLMYRLLRVLLATGCADARAIVIAGPPFDLCKQESSLMTVKGKKNNVPVRT
jgi:hypothetical protein